MMTVKYRLFQLLLIVILFSDVMIARGQTLAPATVPMDCLDSIPAWMSNHKVPVVAASIIENGKIKQTRLFGKLDNGQLVTAGTLFNVASLTNL